MQDVNVVVLFYSRLGSTERLALAAAVGAVQGRANIRLRRLPDAEDEGIIASIPGWKENRDRMNREYVAPRDTDVAWADAILVGMPAGPEALPGELKDYFASLEGLQEKLGASFSEGFWTAPLYAAMRKAGLITVPVISDSDLLTAARLQGRRVAEAARSRRV